MLLAYVSLLFPLVDDELEVSVILLASPFELPIVVVLLTSQLPVSTVVFVELVTVPLSKLVSLFPPILESPLDEFVDVVSVLFAVVSGVVVETKSGSTTPVLLPASGLPPPLMVALSPVVELSPPLLDKRVSSRYLPLAWPILP